MTATFLLIRHAAHVHLDRRLSGRMHGVALSDDGRAQARSLARGLRGARIDRIACSPLERTCDTAAAIAEACGLAAPVAVDALIEIDMGEWTGAAFGSLDGPAWEAWNTMRGTARIPGGETMGEARDRIAAYMREVAGSEEGAVVALVTHADMIRAAIADVIGLPLDNLLRFDIDPASVSRVTVGDWGARLLSLNERVAA